MSFYGLSAKAGRLGLACVSVCLLLVPLSGCAGPAPPLEPVTISFSYGEWNGDHYEALAEEFHKRYPHITVELRPLSRTMYTYFWVGDADTFVTWTGFDNLRMMLEQGHILDLRPFIEVDETFDSEDFYLGEAGFLTDERSVWGLPIGVDMAMMYYNQDLFDQYSVAYPDSGWTWEDFLNIALALRDPDAGVFGYASTGAGDAISLIYQHGGRLFDDLQAPTRATYDDPLTIEAMEWYAALFHEHDVAPTPDQAREVSGRSADWAVYDAIRSGKVGMWTGSLWEQGEQGWGWGEEWRWGFRWGMVPLPRNARAATLSNGTQLFIFAEAQHPKECWQWITFVSKQMPPRGMMPVRRSLAESDAYEQLVGDEVAAATRASVADVLIVSPQVWGQMGIFRQAVTRITTGRNTPQEAMEWAQREAEKTYP